MFFNLQAEKIKNIKKIINSKDRSKPRINIMTKMPSRKQIIVLMSNNNKIKFMEDSSVHITNMNRVFKNIKSKVMADFVWADQSDIIIVTNKVVVLLNLQTIEKYIKNMNHIEMNSIEVSCLP